MNEDRLKHFKNTLDAMINDESEMHRNRLKDAAFYFYKQAIQRVQELEEEIKSHAPEGRNYTNKQYVDLLHENKRYREALENIMKVHEKHKWNMYGIAYGIAENAILESESNEN